MHHKIYPAARRRIIEIWQYADMTWGGKKTDKYAVAIFPPNIMSLWLQFNTSGCAKYNRIEVRFRGKFCYIDAFTEPYVPKNFNSKLFGESREEHIERLRNTPMHLCRLRFFGDENKWSIAFYTYSHEKSEPCIFNTGSWQGTPEEAFDTSAVYLTG